MTFLISKRCEPSPHRRQKMRRPVTQEKTPVSRRQGPRPGAVPGGPCTPTHGGGSQPTTRDEDRDTP